MRPFLLMSAVRLYSSFSPPVIAFSRVLSCIALGSQMALWINSDYGNQQGTICVKSGAHVRLIREMALWINSDYGNQQGTICMKSGARLIPNDINWEIVRQMSLISNQIEKISCSPNCPNLSTLLLRDNFELEDISVGFFRFMPKLVVLDLSRNWSLVGVPEEISNLGSLQYLNLSRTEIESLPAGLKKLRKLIYLNLEYTQVHEISLVGIAATLPNLQVLKLLGSRVCVDDILMEELQHLEHLKILTANVKDATILERIQGIDRLASCIRGLYLRDMSAPRVILSTIALRGLQYLEIDECNISEIKIDWESKERMELSPIEILLSTSSPGFKQLSAVKIFNLEGQRDLSWLLFAQNLKKLEVANSAEIEEIINKEKGICWNIQFGRAKRFAMAVITKVHPDIVVPFGNLEDLHLYRMAELKEICWNFRNLPKLRILYVTDCPKLPEDIASFLTFSSLQSNNGWKGGDKRSIDKWSIARVKKSK